MKCTKSCVNDASMQMKQNNDSKSKIYGPSDAVMDPWTRDVGNFVLNMLLPLSMIGSITKSARRNIKECCVLDSFPPPIGQIEERIAGSSSEGLGLPQVYDIRGNEFHVVAPDMDMVYIFSKFVIHPTRKDAFASIEASPHCPPAFFNVRYNPSFIRGFEGESKPVMDISRVVTDKGYIHRVKFVRMIRSGLRQYIRNANRERSLFRCKEGNIPTVDFSINGPAVTMDIEDEITKIAYSKDYVICLPCPKWPSQARGWPSRNRVWPSKGMISKVVSEGCHIVPKQYSKGEIHASEFTFSFSISDRIICQSLNLNQRRSYLLFKYIFKYQINKVKRGLASYFCKQTFLWFCERKPAEEWLENNILQCVIALLLDFKQYLFDHYLPHYYIPEYNLIGGISSKALAVCVKDIEHFLESPLKTVLQIAETHRFLWLSRDISLVEITQGLLPTSVVSNRLFCEYILKYLSILLDKGEISLVVSIICETWAPEVIVDSGQIVKALEALVHRYTDHDDIVCFKALLANIYHQREEEEKGGFDESFDIFHEIMTSHAVGEHIWIYGMYYDFLHRMTMYEDLITHFLAKLHPASATVESDLFQPGIYTTFTAHNTLTSLPGNFAYLDASFQVPSAPYILYKVIQAYIALAEETGNHLKKRSLKTQAISVLHLLDQWVRTKCKQYPENSDDNLCYILGVAAYESGDTTIARYGFKEACSYGTTYACVDFSDEQHQLPEEPCETIKNGKRFHPYSRVMTRYMRRQHSDKLPSHLVFKKCRVKVGPYIHC